MNFGIHPFILIAAMGLLLGVIAIIVAIRTRRTDVRAIAAFLAAVCLLPAFVVLMAFFPTCFDSRFSTYKKFYDNIHTGMTREQVIALMEQTYPTNGPRKRPKIMGDAPDGLGFFMNPEGSVEPNCEGIFLTLEGGKVTAKDYSPD